ncbi:MAG: FtsK/SpoIIIE domain-containing protein, partial [Anaerolineae bacterium]|nr:FtsK/SpoIIIE domain-containing protein [Anaerolineae bacterium]
MPEPGAAAMPEPGAAAMPEPGAAAMPEPGAAAMPEPGAAAMPEPGAAAMPLDPTPFDDVQVIYAHPTFASEDKKRSLVTAWVRAIMRTANASGVRLRLRWVRFGRVFARCLFELVDGDVRRLIARRNTLEAMLGTKHFFVEIPENDGGVAVTFRLPDGMRQSVTFPDALRFLDENRCGKLSVVLGECHDGSPLVVDFSDEAHALIAGSTGSGKTSLLHAILATLIARASPSDVRLALIDLKAAELTIYRTAPHLWTHVATEAGSAVKVLQGMVDEMERRYRCADRTFPLLFVVVDEMASLFAAQPTARSLLTRIAQMGRAAGMRVIVATQHPLAKVVDSSLKANLNLRIALRTASVDASRVIIDDSGAERLAGAGDMLVRVGGSLVRAQGVWANQDDIRGALRRWTNPVRQLMAGVQLINHGTDHGALRALMVSAAEIAAESGEPMVMVVDPSDPLAAHVPPSARVIHGGSPESVALVLRMVHTIAYRGSGQRMWFMSWRRLRYLWRRLAIRTSSATLTAEQAITTLLARAPRSSLSGSVWMSDEDIQNSVTNEFPFPCVSCDALWSYDAIQGEEPHDGSAR